MVFSSRSATVRRRRIALGLPGTSGPETGDPATGATAAPDMEAPVAEPEAVAETESPEPVDRSDDVAPLPPVGECSVPDAAASAYTIPLPTAAESVAIDPDWEVLSGLLGRMRPLVWLFAGTRAESPESAILGELFAARWRSESARQTDIIVDATCPETSLTHLWTNLSERVLRFRPDVAFVWIGAVDAQRGMSHLSKFERQLEALITSLQRERIVPVLMTADNDFVSGPHDIDGQVYAEAVVSIAKEREALVVNGTSLGNPEALAARLCRGILSTEERAGSEPGKSAAGGSR